ncbi:hypothetical protein DFH08DRAFT_497557 [Mycena albidolilacea]|uniref:Uncharacterized protein n=1 Tax=Mycena albidolilacea TaxID=1033008 RepID=A0AAD7ACR3_9AGAR|nr:hypothetical protein DFH08DRAFT_497557 [Mycena albidolilacea]
MAIIAKMIEDQSFAARSPGDTSPVHSNADSTPPSANETATSSSSTLALSVPDPLSPLLHPADCIPATPQLHNFLGHSTLAVEADPCPELLACLPDVVPSSTPSTDPDINRESSPSFDIPGFTTGLPLSAIDADHWSFLCSKDDADGTFETPTPDMEHTLLWTPSLATCQLLLSETLIMRSNSPPADDTSLWTPSLETSEFPLSEALTLDQSNSSLMDESYSLTPAASWSSSLASCNSTQSLPATPAAQSQTRASSEKENCWGRVHSTDTELKDPETPTKKHDLLEHATEQEHPLQCPSPSTRSCSTDKQRRVVEDYLGGNFP